MLFQKAGFEKLGTFFVSDLEDVRNTGYLFKRQSNQVNSKIPSIIHLTQSEGAETQNPESRFHSVKYDPVMETDVMEMVSSKFY
jgi:hypothetical protein